MMTGLVSATFGRLAPREVINLVQLAGMEAIEWGGDLYVPPGKIALAQGIGRMTRDAGLINLCYGSFFRVGESKRAGLSFSSVLETAAALGSRSIKVWAGGKSSGLAPLVYRENIIRESRAIAEEAAMAHISICFEFHANTLADSAVSTLSLLQSAAHPNLKILWQPLYGMSPDLALSGLSQLLPRVHHLHVTHCCSIAEERRALSAGALEWKKYLGVLEKGKADLPLMLEFARNDSPEQFLEDAGTLKTWLE